MWYVLPKRRFTYGLHGAICQMKATFRISYCFIGMHVTCLCSLTMPSINKRHRGQKKKECLLCYKELCGNKKCFWLMHNTGLESTEICHYVCSKQRGQDMFLTFSLYQKSPGFDSQFQVFFILFLHYFLAPGSPSMNYWRWNYISSLLSLWNRAASRKKMWSPKSLVCKSTAVSRRSSDVYWRRDQRQWVEGLATSIGAEINGSE
jgi:hypothetical protein